MPQVTDVRDNRTFWSHQVIIKKQPTSVLKPVLPHGCGLMLVMWMLVHLLCRHLLLGLTHAEVLRVSLELCFPLADYLFFQIAVFVFLLPWLVTACKHSSFFLCVCLPAFCASAFLPAGAPAERIRAGTGIMMNILIMQNHRVCVMCTVTVEMGFIRA